ncbi:antizyme inhibitor 2-like isoform X2 [Schistocerca gregaria]|uniref:antizyme inhibitor 2-like isoform X2 n=1 Tax=Schistocerca gregaria TaxID=7010 RepID=UPI00211E2940|nr:antizyme inhibitor 2-like isoform X2 [Schistocerca gregaria]
MSSVALNSCGGGCCRIGAESVLEGASLAELKKWLRIEPFVSTARRRGRFVPSALDAWEESSLGGICEKGCVERGSPCGLDAWGGEADRVDDRCEEMEYYLRLRVAEKVERWMGCSVEYVKSEKECRMVGLEALSERCVASFAVVNICKVVDKYLLWRRTMPRVEPFYALKANPDMAIASALSFLNVGFDCASQAELKQALSLPGVVPENVIFANPCKQLEHILCAKECGVAMMTFDNEYELEKIVSCYPRAQLVLRLLPDDSHSLMPFGAKFGASFAECRRLLERGRQLRANIIGVSFHVGSGCYSAAAWVEALRLARRVFDEAQNHLYCFRLLDIGGGFPGSEEGELKLSTIGPAVNAAINQWFEPCVRIIAEPGRFFCTEAVVLVCRIISKRQRLVLGDDESQTPEVEHQYYLTDGIYGSMNCVVFDHAKLVPQLLAADIYNRPPRRTTLWGPTCDSIDVLLKGILFPEAHVGEWIYFKDMGAYTTSAGSTFNGFQRPTPVYIANPLPS